MQNFYPEDFKTHLEEIKYLNKFLKSYVYELEGLILRW